MPYTALSVATLSKLVEDYTKLKALTKAAKVSPSAKVKLDKQIERVSQSAVKSVAVLMKAANREFDSHEVTAKRLLAEAEALLKNTKAAAEAYRKDPTATANVEFVNNFVKDLADRRDSYASDAADFAQAYSAVRAFNAGTLPPAAAEELNTARAALSSKQRATIVIGSQLAAAVKQAEAQRAIVAKAWRSRRDLPLAPLGRGGYGRAARERCDAQDRRWSESDAQGRRHSPLPPGAVCRCAGERGDDHELGVSRSLLRHRASSRKCRHCRTESSAGRSVDAC